MLCSFLLHSKANQLHTHTHTHIYIYIHSFFVCLFVCFAFHLGHHRALSGLPVLCSSFSLSDMDYHLTNALSFFFFCTCVECVSVCVCVCDLIYVKTMYSIKYKYGFQMPWLTF